MIRKHHRFTDLLLADFAFYILTEVLNFSVQTTVMNDTSSHASSSNQILHQKKIYLSDGKIGENFKPYLETRLLDLRCSMFCAGIVMIYA